MRNTVKKYSCYSYITAELPDKRNDSPINPCMYINFYYDSSARI